MSAEVREADQLPDVPAPEFVTRLEGHEGVRNTLETAFRTSRVPGAVMLHGPRGIGKATLAFSLARALFTLTGDEPADRTDAQVSALSHPNLAVLRRRRDPSSDKFASAIRVDDVRSARDSLHRTRGRAGYRVAIIDAVDDCNANSANALLKILEEPPAETLFIVISHKPGGLLPTIRSRCQSFAMRGLADDDVARVLQARRPDIAEAELGRAVSLAGGRPRRALELLGLAEGEVLDALGVWLEAPSRHPARGHLTIADALAAAKDGAEMGFAREMILEWIASQARAMAGQGGAARFRLASLNALWDKANAQFADADIYNLDQRQALIAIFDAIRHHERRFTTADQEVR
ncbi:AAA family ATPase [Pelagibacterium montanilacus]|uniref:AAA family ATPase n=1 Tax=Pelagibacterium montanilacus TaxID=2185280 RepID=UPI0013E005CD|nr:AAA family ATPase [Pelagibacterium montanilacus]